MNAILAGEITNPVDTRDVHLNTRKLVVQEILGDRNSLSILGGLKSERRIKLSGIGQELELNFPGEIFEVPTLAESLHRQVEGTVTMSSLALLEPGLRTTDDPVKPPKADEVSIPLIQPDREPHENDSTNVSRDSVLAKVYEKCKGSIARINAYRKVDEHESKLGLGNGFFVGEDGLVASAWHVIRDSDSIKVKIGDLEYDAINVGEDRANDLVLLKIKDPGGKKFPALALAETAERLKIQQPLFTIGGYQDWSKIYMCPGTMVEDTTLDKKTNTPESYEKGDRRVIVLHANAKLGMSGSPTVDESGKVVAISDKYTVWDKHDYSVVTPVDPLNVLITKYRQSKKDK